MQNYLRVFKSMPKYANVFKHNQDNERVNKNMSEYAEACSKQEKKYYAKKYASTLQNTSKSMLKFLKNYEKFMAEFFFYMAKTIEKIYRKYAKSI